jgi:hypothetical protein
VAVVFFLTGGLLASFAARVPAVQERFGLSDGQLGLAFLALEAGAVLGLPLGGALCARIGSRSALRLGFVVYPAGLAAVLLNPFPALLACALGTSAVDVAMNTHGLERERRSGRRVLSRLHAAHSLGVLAGGLGGTVAAAAGVPVEIHLVAVAATGLLAGQLATRTLRDATVAPGPLVTRPRGRLLGLGRLAFCTFLVDGAASNWSAVHVRHLGAGEGMAAAAFAAFASALAVGRLFGDRRVRGGAARAVRCAGLVAAFGVAIALLAPGAVLAIAGWAVVGLGVAIVAPTVMRAAGPSPASIAAVTVVGYLGSFTGPPLIGGLSTLVALDAALGVLVAASLAIAALAGHATMRA